MPVYEEQAKEIVLKFLQKNLPNSKFEEKMIWFRKTVAYITLQRNKIIITRMVRKKFFTRLFDREHKFLVDFYEQTKHKRERAVAVVKALKRIEKLNV